VTSPLRPDVVRVLELSDKDVEGTGYGSVAAWNGMVRDAVDYVVAVLAHRSGGVGHCGSGAEIVIRGRLIADVESHTREAHR